jgi:hypothetical protein
MSAEAILACGGILAVAGALVALYATAVEPYSPRLRRLVVPVPADWPRLSILHVSDLHARADAPRLHRTQLRFLRALPEADLVCVTGDLCETAEDVPIAAGLVGAMRGRLGTLAVLGNHEHNAGALGRRRESPERAVWHQLAHVAWRLLGTRRHSSGTAEADAIADALTAAGVPVLVNQGVRVRFGDRSLWVGGVDSLLSGRAHGGAALAGRWPGEPCLALAHEPDGALPLLAGGAALALSGHTHGGQVRFPLLDAPYALRGDPRVVRPGGLQRLGRGWLHVSTGLGQTTQLRFFCPPEATLIECLPVAVEARPAVLADAA